MFCEIHLQKFSRDTLIDYVQQFGTALWTEQNVPRMLESNGQCFKHRVSLRKSEQFWTENLEKKL